MSVSGTAREGVGKAGACAAIDDGVGFSEVRAWSGQGDVRTGRVRGVVEVDEYGDGGGGGVGSRRGGGGEDARKPIGRRRKQDALGNAKEEKKDIRYRGRVIPKGSDRCGRGKRTFFLEGEPD
ncbi:hypothetical protein IF2G_07691 [Cordyceps javanica]|nr:hypothetical protein IF2G_07691 [Cordyceps javanica]